MEFICTKVIMGTQQGMRMGWQRGLEKGTQRASTVFMVLFLRGIVETQGFFSFFDCLFFTLCEFNPLEIVNDALYIFLNIS